jgi:AbrB family looped-hinge helix DNA binding protein
MIVRLSSKGQLVIPREIRKALNLQPGAAIELELVDEKIVLKPLSTVQSTAEVIDSLYGLMAGESLQATLIEERRWENRREEERIARYMGDPGVALR